MTALAPNLFERRFGDLVEIGRARLPSLAPEWTDHNAHDPGITVMELLAWVGEAQLYSLSRMRRDERAAYAALVGLHPAGTIPARGVIWPDPADRISPAETYSRPLVIRENAAITVVDTDAPVFRPIQKLLWVPGRVEHVETRHGDGRTTDHTAVNARGTTAYLPFGERAGRRDVLSVVFRSRDDEGLFGADRKDWRGARWAIGVIAAPSIGESGGETIDAPAVSHRSSLSATLVAGDARVPLRVTFDSTNGFLSTGAILLDLDAVAISPMPAEIAIEFRSIRGFARPPRVLRIAPNVIPIQQGRFISQELHVATGGPDWNFTLDVPGLRFDAGADPVLVEVAEADGVRTWRRCDDLRDSGPGDRAYELDARASRITFGNGLNGVIPPTETQVLVSYAVSDGDEGGVARNRKWQVAGFDRVAGVNPDPVAGGAPATGWIDQRREARRRTRDAHALVSKSDIVAAARALPLLEVARAWIVEPDSSVPRTGVVTLAAMRARSSPTEPQVPEPARWLEAIRRRLVARMPLGTRLAVIAPRYVDFWIAAEIEADAGREPAVVKKEIEAQLGRRLALVAPDQRTTPRQPGVPVSQREVGAWLRAVDGVKRVGAVRLIRADGGRENAIAVPRGGLPRWRIERSEIDVTRPSRGGVS